MRDLNEDEVHEVSTFLAKRGAYLLAYLENKGYKVWADVHADESGVWLKVKVYGREE